MIDPATMVNRPAQGRDCGSCTLCCKVYDVPAVGATAGNWCPNCQPGSGCKIYEVRPQQCRAFNCLWITQDFLGPDWKPDKARFVLTMDGTTRWIFVQVDPGAAQAWRKEPYYSQLKRWAAAGNRPVVVFVRKLAIAITTNGETTLGEIGADERLVLRNLPGGRQVVEKLRVGA